MDPPAGIATPSPAEMSAVRTYFTGKNLYPIVRNGNHFVIYQKLSNGISNQAALPTYMQSKGYNGWQHETREEGSIFYKT